MRVLTVGNLYSPAAAGGYERTWAGAVEALRARGHDVSVLTTIPVPGAELPAEHQDEPWVHRELHWWWRDHAFPEPRLRERVAVPRRNRRILHAHLVRRPDVLCWWGMGGMTLGLIEQVRRAGIPAVGVVADEWMTYGPVVDASLPRPRLRLERAARWMHCSDHLASQSGVPGEIVPLGVDQGIFQPRPAAEWSWRLAYVGRVEPRKGVDVAVAAVAELPDARLVVCGPAAAAHRIDLEALAARLGVAERVSFEERSATAVAEVYAAADAILFPVRWQEPWGLVPLEAMSVGRPVVATGTGGSGEYLRHEGNCLLVPPDDARALATAVTRLAQGPELRERLRDAGRRTAARYTRQVFDDAVVEALEQAAQGTPVA